MLRFWYGSAERRPPIKFSPGRIGRARLRRAVEVCVFPASATWNRSSELLWTARLALTTGAAVYDRRRHRLAVGVAVAVAGGRTFGLGMGPAGVGGGVGGAYNFASRNFFRCSAS